MQCALERRGLGPVAGVDEAGRGACAGPLVVASCVLRSRDAQRLTELTDSKLLTPVTRDRVFELVRTRARDYAVVVLDVAEVDAMGVQVANIEGMRRAVAGLSAHPGYVLTDGFRVPGLAAPSVGVIKGDRVAASVAAASVLAKVTRDRLMVALHARLPDYAFDVHKGYATALHRARLSMHGPSAVHRWSYANVAAAARMHGLSAPRAVSRSAASIEMRQNEELPAEPSWAGHS
ncbi:MAG: ribonuclease HII [Sciscionella sp.]